MTDISKYKSLAVDHACYDKIDKMTKLLAPGVTLSRAQVIRMLVEEKAKEIKWQAYKAYFQKPLTFLAKEKIQSVVFGETF